MKKIFVTLFTGIAMLGAMVLTGCEKNTSEMENSNGGATIEGTVTGIVRDAKGNPIAGAKVRVENDFIYYDVTTNAAGKYSCYVQSIGSFKALAWAPVTYEGINYMLRVGMAEESDYDFFDPRKGAIRNFKLQHKGRIPDRSADETGSGYFGATIKFFKSGSIYGPNLESGDVVTYFLTPIGTLMDGTTGQPVQGSFTIQSNKSDYYVVDVPAGKYKAEAVVRRDGADYRVYVGDFVTQHESMEIVPRADDYGTGNYENGFMHPANVVYMTVR